MDSEPPRNRMEYGVRFVCAFLVFGLLFGLVAIRFMEQIPTLKVLGLWAATTLLVSLWLARKGDSGWERIVAWFQSGF